MDTNYITQLYDEEYAESYEQKFLVSQLNNADSEHELKMIGQFLADGGTWLDVACGTGYFLRHFPHIERAGIDISPAMLSLASKGNPVTPLLRHDFREPMPSWESQWDLVSCMWYAYGLVDTMKDMHRLIHNLWTWTSPAGTCFVPLADPRLISGVNIPYIAPSPNPGRVKVVGILWSYEEEDGSKSHSHMIAPSIDYMVERFQLFFKRVEIVRYPPAFPGWEGRPALIASEKKSIDIQDVNI
jgi:SAM-dependent methyltransferase